MGGARRRLKPREVGAFQFSQKSDNALETLEFVVVHFAHGSYCAERGGHHE
jgi:hypothetical protein